MKYRDDIVLLAREETVLEDKIDRLTEIGRCYGMEINVEKARRRESQSNHPQYRRQLTNSRRNVENFNYLGSMLNYARSKREI